MLRQRQCVFPQWRECRQECAGLPSYPTYEFEDCLTECDNRNVQDRQDYDDCVAQGPSSYHDIDAACVKLCDAQNTQAIEAYKECKSKVPRNELEAADKTVDIAHVKREMAQQFPAINDVFRDVAGRNAVVTSGYRPRKGKFSYHQSGDAVDLRIKDLSTDKAVQIFQRLQQELPETYDVCLEVPDPSVLPPLPGCVIKNSQPHIHVEYDRHRVEAQTPAGRTKFPEPPPPIITNHELPGEQQDITDPSLLKELKDAFNGREVLIDETIYLPEGLDVRVSTSAKDVAVWGGQVVGEAVALKVAKYVLPKETLEALTNDFGIISEGKSVYEISQAEPKVSGDYEVGPFTLEIKYLPELIPEGYTEDDVGLFHAVVTEGKLTFSRVKNVFVDKVNKKVFGRVEGFSFYVVGVMPEEAPAPPKPSTFWLKAIPALVALLVIAGIILFLRKRRGKTTKQAVQKKPGKDNGTNNGVVSLVFAIASIFFALPVIGMVLAILAVVFARKQSKTKPTGIATAGLIIGVLGILLNVIITTAFIIILTSYLRAVAA